MATSLAKPVTSKKKWMVLARLKGAQEFKQYSHDSAYLIARDADHRRVGWWSRKGRRGHVRGIHYT